MERFLASPPFAVVGASNDAEKYGAKVLASYVSRGFTAYPINPRETTVQGLPCFASLAELPEAVTAVSIITPPAVTERVVEDAAISGARILWMQPGAESEAAVARAEQLGLDVIHGGACVLVQLALRKK